MTVFHIDANSAYLSWEAVDRLQHGAKLDLRTIPSIVGGDQKKRHGIVLAKSIPAKSYGIKTGETLVSAFQKYPRLTSVAPRYDLYLRCSNAMFKILKSYAPRVQRYSIDECFLDYRGSESLFGDPVQAANQIREHIKNELGFTVNIGVSSNKLLAKMASDFKKPDRVHTLFPEEIKKMWRLPVQDLFMVGRATTEKLQRVGIYTIGDLAHSERAFMRAYLKSHGDLIWCYANGIEDSEVHLTNRPIVKGLGNSTTIAFDVDERRTAHLILLSLTEKVAMRLRALNYTCRLVSVSIKSNTFYHYSHQRKLCSATDCTNEIFAIVRQLFDEIWHGDTIRHLGVRVSALTDVKSQQLSIWQIHQAPKMRQLDRAVDAIRYKHGMTSIIRGSFLHSRLKPIKGGVGEDDYPLMSSIL